MPLHAHASQFVMFFARFRRAQIDFGKEFASRQEEHSIRSIIHQIGYYTDETKLGLQVYHLQELSKSSFKHFHFEKSDRYNELLDFVMKKSNELTSAQLIATALSYRRLNIHQASYWKPLKKRFLHLFKVTREKSQLDPKFVGISTSDLVYFANIATPHAKLTKSELQEIISMSSRQSQHWGEYDITNMLSLMRKGRLSPNLRIMALTWEYFGEKGMKEVYERKTNVPGPIAFQQKTWSKALKSLVKESYSQAHSFSPATCSMILYEMSRLRWTSEPLCHRLLQQIKFRLNELNDQQLCMLAIGVNRHHIINNGFIKQLARTFALRVGRPYNSRTVATLALAFARMNSRNVEFIAALCKNIEHNALNFTFYELSIIIYALGHLGIRHLPTWEILLAAAKKEMNSMGGLHLSMIAQAIGKVGLPIHVCEPILNDILKKSVEVQGSFSSKQLVHLLAGCTRSGISELTTFETLLSRLVAIDESRQSFSRATQMREIVFSLIIEHGSVYSALSEPVKTSLSRYEGLDFSHKEERVYHAALVDCLASLSLDVEQLVKLGPYTVDAITKHPLTGKGALIDLCPRSDLCPITGEALGYLRMKNRHVKLLLSTKVGNSDYSSSNGEPIQDLVLIKRTEWLTEEKMNKRINMLRDAFGGHVGEIALFGSCLSVNDEDEKSKVNNLVDRDVEWKQQIAKRVGLLSGSDSLADVKLSSKGEEDFEQDEIVASMLGNGIISTGPSSALTSILNNEFSQMGESWVERSSLTDDSFEMNGENNYSLEDLLSDADNNDAVDIKSENEAKNGHELIVKETEFHPPCRKGEIWDPNLKRIRVIPRKSLKRIETMAIPQHKGNSKINSLNNEFIHSDEAVESQHEEEIQQNNSFFENPRVYRK